jgi:hypothetical protein
LLFNNGTSKPFNPSIGGIVGKDQSLEGILKKGRSSALEEVTA